MNGEYNGDFNNIKEEKVCVKYNQDDEGHRSDFYKGGGVKYLVMRR